MRAVYIIGRENPDGSASYYAEGFGIHPQWTARHNANGYYNRRDALREARAVGGYVTWLHHPFGGPDERLTAKRGVRR